MGLENKELKDYEEELNNHDWFYEMSESMSVYDNGKFNHDRLVRTKKGKPILEEAYLKVRNEKFNKIKV